MTHGVSYRRERGVSLIVVALMTGTLLIVLGLAIDTLRLTLSVRQLEDTTAMLARAAADRLSNNGTTSLNAYRDVKRVVLQLLPFVKIQGASPNAIAAFQQGPMSAFDDSPYDHQEEAGGGLRLGVVRGITCFDANTARFIPVDSTPVTAPATWALAGGTYQVSPQTHLCRVNAVKVFMSMDRLPTLFIRLVGMLEVSSIDTFTIAAPGSSATSGQCGQPNCNVALAACP